MPYPESLKKLIEKVEATRSVRVERKKKGEEYSIEENRALSLALELTGFLPIIYSAAQLTSAAGYRFKCQLNENSKLHAFSNVIPEMNHNEIIGWETFEEKKLFTKLITISDPDYHPQIKKRFKITSELAKQSGVEIINTSLIPASIKTDNG